MRAAMSGSSTRVGDAACSRIALFSPVITGLRYLLAAAIYAGKLSAYWNLPLFSFSSTNPELIDKTMFSTLVRVMSPFNHMATALRHVFNFFGVSIYMYVIQLSRVV